MILQPQEATRLTPTLQYSVTSHYRPVFEHGSRMPVLPGEETMLPCWLMTTLMRFCCVLLWL